MPPATVFTPTERPAVLAPFAFHGLRLTPVKNGSWTCDCPQCGKGGGKFSIHGTSGLYNCFVCSFKGNPVEFLRWLWQTAWENTTPDQYEELRKSRKLLSRDTPRAWGAAVSPLTGEWILPGYSHDGRLVTLYRYEEQPPDIKHPNSWFILKCTPRGEGTEAGGHGMFLPEGKVTREYATVHVLEGPWDGMAFWEVARQAKPSKAGWSPVADPGQSYAAGSLIFATPGANVFFPPWAELFDQKSACFYFDNDHPKINPKTKAAVEPAAIAGVKRAVAILSTAERGPTEVRAVRWGGDGRWHDEKRKGGYDVRDALSDAGNTVQQRVTALAALMALTSPVPSDWVPNGSGNSPNGRAELELVPCEKWADVVNALRQYLDWSEGLDRALSIMLACVASTESAGDQLWVKVIGPPSSGKTSLVEGLAANRRYVLSKSKIQGFHSGYNIGGGENISFIRQLNNKTFVVKDGDTLLSNPNLDTILGEARDLYDRVTSSDYKNGMGADYRNLNITWILCGTETLRELDSSELGERFIDCVMMDRVAPEQERKTALRTAHRAFQDLAIKSDGTSYTTENPKAVRFKQVCGGYVQYLRENAQALVSQVEPDDDAIDRFVALGEFVSYTRARPSRNPNSESVTKELCYRLGSQFTRLAGFLAVVLNRRSLGDPEVLRRTTQTALDTGRGRTLKLMEVVYKAGEEGMTIPELAVKCNQTEHKVRELVTFLCDLKATEKVRKKQVLGEDPFGAPILAAGPPRVFVRLTSPVYDLFQRIYSWAGGFQLSGDVK